MRILGIVLILFGIAAFVFKGITYTEKKKVVDIGPIEATADDKKTIPISPIVGGIAVAGGIVILLTSKKGAKI